MGDHHCDTEMDGGKMYWSYKTDISQITDSLVGQLIDQKYKLITELCS